MDKKSELKAATARLLYNSNRSTSDYDMLIDFIDSHFDGQPQDGWIPCSERLPGVADEYEVTVDCDGKLFTTNSFYDVIESDWNTWENHITAWRERLPEPYKGE